MYGHINSVRDAIKLAREGAAVRRVHTIPHIGEYVVGHHSFNMLAMLRILYPEASSSLIWAILEHDIPERLIGDIPSPAKWFGIVDRDRLIEVERTINTEIFGSSAEYNLNPKEIKWLNSLDLFELWLWCKDQIAMGNQNLVSMHDRILNFVNRNRDKFVEPILTMFYELADDPWQMMPELGD